jgi:type I restriction enzyme S subunit
MSNVRNQQNVQPAIRFKGFTDAWEQRKLGTIVDVRSGKDYKHLQTGTIPVYGTGGYMLSVNAALSEKTDAIGIGRKGTIDHPYILRAPFWTVDTLFYAIPRKGFNLNFVNALFQLVNWKRYDESTGVPSLSKATINSIEVKTPSVSEQEKIGTQLLKLDTTIALHQRKVENLQQLKKSLLQQMFVSGKDSVPRIRFAGFTDAWEQRKLGDIAEIIGGGTPSTSKAEYWDGDIDWYAPAEIGERRYVHSSQKKITNAGLKSSSARMLPIGTVLFTSRAGIGKTAILAAEACTNQGFQSIVPIENELDSYFIFSRTEELKRYGEVNGAGSTFVEVSGKTMAKMQLNVPSMKEQREIGQFFQRLDDTIALHQRKIENLQNLKKSLLRLMFV